MISLFKILRAFFTTANSGSTDIVRWSALLGTMPEVRGETIPTYVTKPFNLPLPEYADEAAAAAGGLIEGDLYRTATGEVRQKLADP